MQTTLVMTVIGRDRTGLVETLARFVADHDGNWLESRMCRLGGEFAGIVRVAVPTGQQVALIAALQSLTGQGLAVVVRPDVEAASAVPLDLLHLDLVGHDRPGIVREITAALAAQGVSCLQRETGCAVAAPPALPPDEDLHGKTLARRTAD